jgi:hypothetical protein
MNHATWYAALPVTIFRDISKYPLESGVTDTILLELRSTVLAVAIIILSLVTLE